MSSNLTELNIYKFKVEKFLGICLDESSQKLCISNFLNIDIPCAYTISYKERNGACTVFYVYAFTESIDIVYVKHLIEMKLNVKVVDYDDDCELAEVVCFNRNDALQKLVENDMTVSNEDTVDNQEDEPIDNVVNINDCKRKIFEVNV